MKSILLGAAVTVLVFAGCKKQDQAPTEMEELKLFEKGKGLRLPDETCEVMGVETLEVTEKLFHKQVEVSAQVYENGRENPARALARVRAEQVANLKPGTAVTLLAPGVGTNGISGTLTRLDNLGSEAEALLEFADPNGRFPVGSFVSAVITASEAHSALAVPEDSVIRGVAGPFVYTTNGAHFTRTPVRTGSAADGFIEVVDGLYAGDSVVAKGVERMWMVELYALKGGTPCCPVPKKNTAAN